MEEKKPVYIAGGNVNLYSHCESSMEIFKKKTKIDLPVDPTISLLFIYPEKTLIRKYTCISMFIEALFTIAKTWKQPVSINR